MAPMMVDSQGSASSYQALVNLEKSTTSVQEQLAAASQIVKLQIDTENSNGYGESVEEETTHFGPREEWILRWILNKLSAKDAAGDLWRTEPRAWLLLRQLVRTIPIRAAARLMISQNLCLRIDEALLVASKQSQAFKNPETTHSLSKKRKRPSGGGEIPSSSFGLSPLESQTLLISVSSVVASIVRLSKSDNETSRESLSCEYMKSVLRADASLSARILGNAFTVAGQVLKEDGKVEYLSDGLQSLVEIWYHRIVDVADIAGRVSNEAFSTHALTPAGILLNACHKLLSNHLGAKKIIDILERLIAIHVFLPARASFLDSEGKTVSKPGSKANESTSDKTMSLPQLLGPLHSQINKMEHSDRAFEIGSVLLDSIPMLFELALRSLPTYGPRWRVNESTWLEKVFCALMDCAGMPLDSSSALALRDIHHATIERLLQVMLDYHISIDTNTLRKLVVRSTELVTDKPPGDVQWTMISKILKLDANVFLLEGSESVQNGELPRKADDLLSLLFFRITQHGQNSQLGTSHHSKAIRTLIILPLMEEFARVRDLDGFLERWQSQLREFYQTSLTINKEKSKKSTRVISVWEHDDLIRQLEKLLEGSLTSTQISRELEALGARVNAGQDDLGRSENIANVMSSVVVAEAIISSITQDETLDALSAIALISYEMILRLLALDANELTGIRWRLYRLLTQIHRKWTLAFSVSSFGLTEDKSSQEFRLLKDNIKPAAKFVKKFVSKEKPSFKHLDKNLEASEAFRFLSTLAYVLPSQSRSKSSALEAFNSAATYIIEILEDVSRQFDGNEILGICWRGETDELTNSSAVALSFMLPFIESPELLSQVSPELRNKLLLILYELARKEKAQNLTQPRSFNGLSFVRVWESLLDDDVCLDNSSLRAEVSAIVSSQFSTSAQRKGEKDLVEETNYSAGCFLRTPLNGLSRHQREGALDKIYEQYLEASPQAGTRLRALYLSTMVKLMRLPNPSAQIAMNTDALWRLAKSIQSSTGAEESSLGLFIEELQKLNLEHLISTRDQLRSRQYLVATFERINSLIGQSQSFSTDIGLCCLVTTTISVFYAHRNELNSVTSIEPASLVHKWLQVLITDLATLMGNFSRDNIHTSIVAVNWVVRAIITLIDASDDALLRRKVAVLAKEALASLQTQSATDLSVTISGEADYLALFIRLYEVIVRAEEDDITIYQTLGSCLLSQSITEAQEDSILESFRLSSRKLSVNKKISLLCELRRGALDEQSTPKLILLKAFVEDIDDYNPGTERLRNECIVTFFTISKSLNNTSSYEHFVYSVDSLEMMAGKKGFPMSQWNVDSLMGSLNTIASAAGPRLPSDRSGSIFLKLCHILNIVMSLHRTKLGGRFHLLVTLLQNLLHCLLVTGGKSESSTRSARLPPWCAGGQSIASSSAGTACAEAFGRLLSTLCEPSVFQVTGSRTRAKRELNDEVRKAKATVAKYLPYLLMKYIECQLHARVSAEQKEALAPGFHAVFGLLSPETLRALNAAMDSSSRAIFKNLYDDYRRFGRWQET